MTDQANKYLTDILQAINLIESFTSDITNYDQYISDLKTQSAVERQLGIHAYDAVDPSIIWAIIKRHLDPLKEEIIETQKK